MIKSLARLAFLYLKKTAKATCKICGNDNPYMDYNPDYVCKGCKMMNEWAGASENTTKDIISKEDILHKEHEVANNHGDILDIVSEYIYKLKHLKNCKFEIVYSIGPSKIVYDIAEKGSDIVDRVDKEILNARPNNMFEATITAFDNSNKIDIGKVKYNKALNVWEVKFTNKPTYPWDYGKQILWNLP